MANDLWLVVGLGNPGPTYAGNRHNAGFMVADLLADRLGARFKAHKGRADAIEGRFAGQRVLLAKPKCYMNESGGPVASLRDFFKEYFQTEYPTTKTVLFSGGTNTGCGNATSQTGPFYCPADSLVYIDLEFLQQLETELVGETADLAEQYIIAHEYGHHVQNVLGTNRRAQEGQQAGGGERQRVLDRARAAGRLLRRRLGRRHRRSRPARVDAEVNEALNAAAGVGDDRIQQKTQGRIDPESWTHGSAEQRQQWFTTGFESRDPSACDTFTGL